MTTSNVVFLLVLGAAAAFFSFSAQRLVRYLRLGTADHRLNDIPRRVWNLVGIGFAQSKILRDPVAGPLHAAVFWGFVILQVGALEILIQGVVPGFTYASLLPPALHYPFL